MELDAMFIMYQSELSPHLVQDDGRTVYCKVVCVAMCCGGCDNLIGGGCEVCTASKGVTSVLSGKV